MDTVNDAEVNLSASVRRVFVHCVTLGILGAIRGIGVVGMRARCVLS